jgi:hypothetical protein
MRPENPNRKASDKSRPVHFVLDLLGNHAMVSAALKTVVAQVSAT